MPEVEISKKKPSLTSESGSPLKKASGVIGDIINLVSKGEQLFGHIENIVGIVRGGGAGSSIITSKETAPVTSNEPQKQPDKAQEPQKSGPTDKDMEAYFSTPEGIKKIVETIDKIQPVIGDLKLSELKQALQSGLSADKKPKSKGVKK